MSTRKKVLLLIWGLLILAGLLFYLFRPELFTVAAIREFLAHYQGSLLLAYTAISLLRGLILIPSTPFVLAGAVLFPDQLFMVLLISVAGVLAGSSYVFFFTEYLDMDRLVAEKFHHKYELLKSKMERFGLWIVALWAFFPIVPTDLISYAAGISRMPYWKFALGILLGEAPLITAYVYSGGNLSTWLLS